MLQVFVDESASKACDRRFHLCAYIATTADWEAFSSDWKNALNEHPKICSFHMHEAWSLTGEFTDWSLSARDSKLTKLANIIKKYNLIGFDVSISINKFDKLYKPNAPYPLQKPYFLCFQGIIITVARFVKAKWSDVSVDFVFDENHSSSKDVIFYFDAINENFPEFKHILASTPTFENDKHVTPLQAADMLAWNVRKRRESPDIKVVGSDDVMRVIVTNELPEESLLRMADEANSFPEFRKKSVWKKYRDSFKN